MRAGALINCSSDRAQFGAGDTVEVVASCSRLIWTGRAIEIASVPAASAPEKVNNEGLWQSWFLGHGRIRSQLLAVVQRDRKHCCQEKPRKNKGKFEAQIAGLAVHQYEPEGHQDCKRVGHLRRDFGSFNPPCRRCPPEPPPCPVCPALASRWFCKLDLDDEVPHSRYRSAKERDDGLPQAARSAQAVGRASRN